jgi:hypothetical protein
MSHFCYDDGITKIGGEMSYPDSKAEFEEFKNEVMSEFRHDYYSKNKRFPTPEESLEYWEDYLAGDLRIGED